MKEMLLHSLHQQLGATFTEVNGMELVADYGDISSEYKALTETAGLLDLSFRGRLCLTGSDRIKFLHGQVTNDVNRLAPGSGCYAALITGKGRMQSDLNIYRLDEELLLDFEPGLGTIVSQRLEKYVISEEVQVIDVSEPYGLLSIQGPKAKATVSAMGFAGAIPDQPFRFIKESTAEGDIYLVNRPRFGREGFDLFLPAALQAGHFEKLLHACREQCGTACGWNSAEVARIEAGIPRFGADMDESNIPLEAGLENRAISFNKGCYIGQEVISRIRTYSEVAKALRLIRFLTALDPLPSKGEKLFKDGKEVGYITSATHSTRIHENIGFAYVRKEFNAIGTELSLSPDSAHRGVVVARLPFEPA